MSEIKSKKALEYIHEYIPWAYMTLVIKTIQIAEQEAEERHAKEIQELKAECEKYKSLYENNESAIDTCRVAVNKLQELKKRAVEAFKEVMFDAMLDCKDGRFITENYKLDYFTQKLTKKQ